MKILITGGAGFIGSALTRHILQRVTDAATNTPDAARNAPDTVVNVDKLTYAGNLRALAPVADSPRYAFEQVDICDGGALDRVFARHQPDAVMHLAAESHVDRSISGPDAFVQTNLVGTYTLLEAARRYWQALPASRKTAFRFHHISTDEVYGDGENLPGGFTETTPYAPSSPYSATKAGSDHLVRAWHRTYGLPVLLTNCSNNYGPWQFPEKLIPLTISNALAGKPLPVYGKGDQVRDWLYVEDHAQALYQVIRSGVVGETYNIGGHNEQRNIDVVRAICDLLQELAPPASASCASVPSVSVPRTSVPAMPSGVTHYRDLITFVPDRPGHDRRYAIDASKIQRELGWAPRETFESGLRKTVRWYLER